MDVTGLERATPVGRRLTIGHWRMEEAQGRVAKNATGLGLDATLSAQMWTNDTPAVPGVRQNFSALDFRDRRQHVAIDHMGYYGRSGRNRAMRSSHLGNLYFTDHTIELSFWWDGSPSETDQYLYGASGGGLNEGGGENTFGYGGWIPAGSRTFIHWQRGNYGGQFGGIEINLERARSNGVYQVGRWANVAIQVRTIDSRNWRVFLDGREVTDQPWVGVLEGHPSVGGFITPLDGTYFHHVFPIDLALGARNDTDQGIVDYFDGMLDEVRITAGQVPEEALLAPDISTAVEEGGKAALPDAAELGQSFPNPFNSTARIHYAIAAPTEAASLTIYDLLGQRVRELVPSGRCARWC